MVYSSLLFIYVFFPLSLIVFCLTPRPFKDIAMLALSMVFAAAFGLKYLFFLMLFTAVNYLAARLVSLCSGKFRQLKAVPFALGLIFDFSAILSFRTEIFAFLSEPMKLPETFFPFGISFFTLSAAGYLIDVYRGRIRAERNFVRFGLFIMMFPRLLMGPVLSYDSFIRIMKNRRFNMSRLDSGLTVFIAGFAKKVLLADNLYMLWTAIKSSDISQLSAVTAWLGMIAYVLCLYFTLSGFADMGVGIGCCFGYRFPYSFTYPMFSSKIRYFASRWHIQMIHWFRRYITQIFSERIRHKWLSDLIFIGAWSLAGFWYGFDLTSAVWGALMGVAITVERRLRNSKMLRSTGIIYTFLATMIIAVFLAESSISGSLRYIYAMIGGNRVLVDSMTGYLLGAYIVLVLIAMYASTDLFRNVSVRLSKTKLRTAVSIVSPVIMTAILALCTALITYTGSSGMQIIRL